MFQKNRHTSDSWNWIIRPWITNRKPWECLPAVNLPQKDLVTDLQYHSLMSFPRPWLSLTCLIRKGPRLFKALHLKKSCFYTDLNPGSFQEQQSRTYCHCRPNPHCCWEGDLVSWSPRETAGSLQSNETALNPRWSYTIIKLGFRWQPRIYSKQKQANGLNQHFNHQLEKKKMHN